MKSKKVLLITLISLFSLISFSQQTKYQLSESQRLLTAEDLFLKQKYGAARIAFEQIAKKAITPVEISEAELFTAISASRMQNEDAEYLLEKHIENNITNSENSLAYFELGNNYFYQKKYSQALKNYEQISIDELSAEKEAELNFNKGYCYLRSFKTNKALDLFTQVKDSQTKFKSLATYYYAHIMYEKGNYPQALEYLNQLANDVYFKDIVPYYIVQIYYLEGRYDEMINIYEKIKYNNNPKVVEMSKLIAFVHFMQNNYSEVINAMDKSKSKASILTPEESYILGFSLMKEGKHSDAIAPLQIATKANDTIAQNTFYNLAECYLKTDKKNFALSSFLSAWKIPIKSEVAEDALFNYAKLSLELSQNPFNEALKALQQYIDTYPFSKRKNEALEYMAQLYLITKNYNGALDILDKIEHKNAMQNTIYQKVTYCKGIELFNSNDFFNAISFLKKSLENRRDATITSDALYWTGEAFYKLEQLDISKNYFDEFLNLKESKSNEYFQYAKYNLGYIELKKENYKKAINFFESYLNSNSKNSKNSKTNNDALIRMGDCYFMLRNYSNAQNYYTKAIDLRANNMDYALYKNAQVEGLLSSPSKKISDLQKIISNYPSSQYCDDALYEIGQTYFSLNENAKAINSFNKLISNYPKSSYVKNSYLSNGLVYYNTNDNIKAIESLKKVIDDYPNTVESKEALTILRNIYIDMNQVDTYVEYAQKTPFANISQSEQDSLSFTAAEALYMNGDCEKAITGFKNYISKFNDGIFSLKAHFFKADCEQKNGNKKAALSDYNYIISKARNSYSEAAISGAAALYIYFDSINKALEMYQLLEEIAENGTVKTDALLKQLECNYKLENYGQAIQNGQLLLNSNSLTNVQKADVNTIAGISAYNLRRYDIAKGHFLETINLNKNEKGAQAQYYLALIEYDNGNLKKAEDLIFELSTNYASYDYWVAKSFILLADVYVKTDNIFQAEQTLKSVIDNYNGDDLRKIAQEKLNKIKNDKSAINKDN